MKIILIIFCLFPVFVESQNNLLEKDTLIDKKDSIFEHTNLYNLSQDSILHNIVKNPYIQTFDNIDNQYIYQFKKPKFWDIFKYIPNDLYSLGLFTIQKKNLKWDALALGSTLAMIPFDQAILDGAGDLGEKMGGWNEDPQYDKLFGVFNIIPRSIHSAVYYLGNGGTTILLSAAFYGIGKIQKNNYRALNTSSELMESIFSVGITTQVIKRITGRQSPNRAIEDGNPGGAWNFFPSFSEYQNRTPNYDAMPSGHLATYTAALTIISTNYPEIKWIKPVGYSLGGLLAFSMVSGKVHWASDYPIAIFLGYVMGKNIANRRIQKIEKQKNQYSNSFKFPINTSYSMSHIGNTQLYGINISF